MSGKQVLTPPTAIRFASDSFKEFVTGDGIDHSPNMRCEFYQPLTLQFFNDLSNRYILIPNSLAIYDITIFCPGLNFLPTLFWRSFRRTASDFIVN